METIKHHYQNAYDSLNSLLDDSSKIDLLSDLLLDLINYEKRIDDNETTNKMLHFLSLTQKREFSAYMNKNKHRSNAEYNEIIYNIQTDIIDYSGYPIELS